MSPNSLIVIGWMIGQHWTSRSIIPLRSSKRDRIINLKDLFILLPTCYIQRERQIDAHRIYRTTLSGCTLLWKAHIMMVQVLLREGSLQPSALVRNFIEDQRNSLFNGRHEGKKLRPHIKHSGPHRNGDTTSHCKHQGSKSHNPSNKQHTINKCSIENSYLLTMPWLDAYELDGSLDVFHTTSRCS